MFFEVLNQTYHIPITIDSSTQTRVPLYSSVFVTLVLPRERFNERPMAIRNREAPKLSAEASDTGLVSAAQCHSLRTTPVQRFPELLNSVPSARI